MALVLAVDPELRQRAPLERLARELAGHQLVSVPSCADALATIQRTVPDLILLSLLVAEVDEAALLSRARELAGGTEVPALTIPLLASSDPALQGRRAAETRVGRSSLRSCCCRKPEICAESRRC